MRKRCNRMRRRAMPPAMVALAITPESGLSEQTSLLGFEQGWAIATHYNCLLDCADALMIAAEKTGNKTAQGMAQMGRVALENISARYAIKKRIGASGDELKALRALVDFSDDYWNRQSGARFAETYFALDDYRAWQKKERAAA